MMTSYLDLPFQLVKASLYDVLALCLLQHVHLPSQLLPLLTSQLLCQPDVVSLQLT